MSEATEYTTEPGVEAARAGDTAERTLIECLAVDPRRVTEIAVEAGVRAASFQSEDWRAMFIAFTTLPDPKDHELRRHLARMMLADVGLWDAEGDYTLPSPKWTRAALTRFALEAPHDRDEVEALADLAARTIVHHARRRAELAALFARTRQLMADLVEPVAINATTHAADIETTTTTTQNVTPTATRTRATGVFQRVWEETNHVY